MPSTATRLLTPLLAALAFPLAAAAQPCTPVWEAGFGGGGLNAPARSAVMFDDGQGGGPALYIGGAFSDAGGIPAIGIARWDGHTFSTVGGGVGGGSGSPVNLVGALAVYDDGTGPALYAAGGFLLAGGQPANRIAKWDGQTWTTLGSGIQNGGILDMRVHDDGSGDALYVAGPFTSAGGVPALGIARWNGSAWSTVGAGLGPSVFCLEIFDDGAGPALYSHASGDIRRWDGQAWTTIGSANTGEIRAMAVFNDGTSNALYIGGGFTTLNFNTMLNIARWDGQSWSPVGGGLLNGAVHTLRTADVGSGAALYAGGRFTSTGAAQANFIARWDGNQWSALGAGLVGGVNPPLGNVLGTIDDGTGSSLLVSGNFTHAGGDPAENLALWDGDIWFPFGHGLNERIYSLTTGDDGAGAALFVGGAFTHIGDVRSPLVARFNGETWSAFPGLHLPAGAASNGGVRALALHEHRAGGTLYAGGLFGIGAALPTQQVARWSGEVWESIGQANSSITAMAIYDDGAGPALHVGGAFTNIGGVPIARIARWDGTTWTAVGGGRASPPTSLIVFDDGSGEALWATIGLSVHRWDGQQWTVTGQGLTTAVQSLTVHDDGAGPALYAGGARVHRWDGQFWNVLGNTNFIPQPAAALASFDDGGGGSLFAAGGFTIGNPFPPPPGRIARWDGQAWLVHAGGLNAAGHAMAVFQGGLYIGGEFERAGEVSSSRLARWGCPTPPPPICYANCDGSAVEPILNVDDFTCFINEFASAQALPHEQQITHYANCDSSTISPALNVDDFTCFINSFAAGCP